MRESYQKIGLSLYISREPGSQWIRRLGLVYHVYRIPTTVDQSTVGGAKSARIQFKGSRLLFDLTWERNLSKSKKVSEILRYENFMDMRFRHDLTHENDRHSLNFWDRVLIFWTFSDLYVFKKSYLAT